MSDILQYQGGLKERLKQEAANGGAEVKARKPVAPPAEKDAPVRYVPGSLAARLEQEAQPAAAPAEEAGDGDKKKKSAKKD